VKERARETRERKRNRQSIDCIDVISMCDMERERERAPARAREWEREKERERERKSFDCMVWLVCVTWFISVCDKAQSHVWHGSYV